MDPELIHTRHELASALTSLREAAGLSLRRLATLVDAPLGTLGGYFSGQHLPTVAQTPLFRKVLHACGVTDPAGLESWLAAVSRVRRQPARRSQSGSQPAPFRGLESFQPEDADWFYGREALTEVLLDQARSGGVFAVVGASGSGKSSLLRAGLVAGLRTPKGDGPAWTCVVMTPAQDPLGELCRALAGPGGGAVMADAPTARQMARIVEGPLLIVVDQCEELFAGNASDPLTQGEFIRVLFDIVEQRNTTAPTAIAIGLRADFYADASRDPALLTVLQERQVLIGPLSRAGLRRAIEEPARRAGMQVDPDLVDFLISELAPRTPAGGAHDEGALPLLSHALRQTWLRATGGRLTLADFTAAGGIGSAVQQTAESTFESLDPQARILAKRLFLRMVNVEADAAVTRRRVGRDQLLSDDPASAHLERQILDRFVAQRLLTADDLSVQLSHEALLTAWHRLADWIERDRVGLQRHREVRSWAKSWREGGRDDTELLTGGRLATIVEWARGSDSVADLDPWESEFLDASIGADQNARRARRLRARRLRQLVAVAVVLALVAGAAAVFGFTARSQAVTDRSAANEARDRALSRQLAGSSNGLRGTDPALAAQLALLAYRTSPTLEARSALLDSSSVPTPTRLIGPTGPIVVVPNAAGSLMAVSDAVDGSIALWDIGQPTTPVKRGVMPDTAAEQHFAGAFSPDGTLFVSGGSNGSVVLWDVTDPDHPAMVGRPLELPDITAGVRAVAFARRGGQLLAEGRGQPDASGAVLPTVSRWDITDPTSPRPLTPLPAPGAVLTMSVTSVGDVVAVGGTGGVGLWRLTADGGASQLSAITPAGKPTQAVAFSPDGRTLATGTSDRFLQIWNVTDPTTPRDLGVGPGKLGAQINGLTFSPDGRILGAADSDTTVSFWETTTWSQLGSFPHTGPATGIQFTRDQRTVVTSSTDGTARIWPFPGPVLGGIRGSVLNLIFADDGKLIVGSNENPDAMRIWNVADRLHPRKVVDDITGVRGPGPLTGSAAITPDGTLAAGGTSSGAVGLWRIANGQAILLSTLPGMKDNVSSLLFSADSKQLIGTGRDKAVTIWDVRNPGSPQRTSSSALVDKGLFATFAPDGRRFAAADVKGHVTLWDAGTSKGPSNPTKLADLTGVGTSANTVAFSPDGRFLAAGGIDKTVLVWNIENPAAPVQVGPRIAGPRSEIYWLAYSPDNRQLAGASLEGKAWIWDMTDTGATVSSTLSLPAGNTFSVAFSHDGSTLAAAGTAGLVNLWMTDPAAVASTICAHQGQGITQSEWHLYLPDQAYAPPC